MPLETRKEVLRAMAFDLPVRFDIDQVAVTDPWARSDGGSVARLPPDDRSLDPLDGS